MLIRLLNPKIPVEFINKTLLHAREITGAEEVKLVSPINKVPIVLEIPSLDHLFMLEKECWETQVID